MTTPHTGTPQAPPAWAPAAQDSIQWLVDRVGHRSTGFDLGKSPAGLWILNAMYEKTDQSSATTHHQQHRRQLDAGTTEPWRIGSWDERDDDSLTVTGGGLGWSQHPGPSWRRLRWHELADRTGDPIVPDGMYPCFRVFPSAKTNGSWPASIDPPTEGSMDIDSFRRLAAILNDFASPDTITFAYYCQCRTHDYDKYQVFQGQLRSLEGLDQLDNDYSPSNIWPADHSWLIYTDWDLCGTKITGPPELLTHIEKDDLLETIRLPLATNPK